MGDVAGTVALSDGKNVTAGRQMGANFVVATMAEEQDMLSNRPCECRLAWKAPSQPSR